MNRVDDFDQTLSAWLRDRAPAQAPDRVLDAALGRVAVQSQQHGWVARVTGGTRMPTLLRAAAAVAVVVVAGLIGYEFATLNASVGPSLAPSPSPTTPVVSPSPVPTLSPVDSQSGIPVASEGTSVALLLRLQMGTELGPVHVLTVLDDGRAITTRDEGATREERVLSPAGIQLIRAELNATGLTDKSAQYLPVANPGKNPPGYAGATNLDVVLPGGEAVRVAWYLFPDTAADYYKPQPEAEVLDALKERLATLEEWLPANAWTEAASRPYAPTQYRIYVSSYPWGGALNQLPVETVTVIWPLIDGVDVYGDVVQLVARKRGDADSSAHCRIATVAEGAAVIEALEAAGAAPSSTRLIPGVALELGYRANRRQVVVNIEPILPFADTSCGREITF
jgi:hypothetical protein